MHGREGHFHEYFHEFADFAVCPSRLCFFERTMSDTYIQIGTINNNTQDNHREMTVNVSKDADVSELIRAFMGDSKQQNNPKQNLTFPFIVPQKLEELGLYTLEEFQCMYREAVEGNAKTLASFLKKYHDLHVLDFEGKNKKQIFSTLQAFFPNQIKYEYNNFLSYF